MATDTGPKCKECRSAGMKLFLKGDRCYNDDKCGFKKRSYPPGARGRFSRRERNASEFAIQLKEKQRARWMYGISESQFRKYYEIAAQRQGVTGEILFQLLERRLDNVVFRMGFAASRRGARQLVRHRHITVNGRIIDIPSYLSRTNDLVQVKEQSKTLQAIRESATSAVQRRRVPAWIETNPLELKGTVLELPAGDKMDLSIEIKDHLIVEYYSR